MTDDLFLIAHKVRGEPAFDIATRVPCPECQAEGCDECDDLGYWWIVPTSGHRAYPWWHAVTRTNGVPPMPLDLPDHYLHRQAPSVSLLDALGLGKPTTTTRPFPRRL